jgi:hypothetical protein
MWRKIYQIARIAILIGINIFAASCVSQIRSPSQERNVSDTASPSPQPDFSVPNGWVLYPKPKPLSSEIYCANEATGGNEWKVGAESGKLTISNYSYNEKEQLGKLPEHLKEQILKSRNTGIGAPGYLHIEEFSNGWLVGSDAGEWGGKLYWLSKDGLQKIKLLTDNIRGIITLGESAFILSGMAHLSTDDGKIYKVLLGENSELQSEVIADLKTQPQSFLVENESILVLLKDKLLRLDHKGQTTVLAETDYSLLYPNSMAATSSGVVYVGMRLFLVRFVPDGNGYREEWLVRRDCTKFVEKDFDCVCHKDS